MSQKIICRFDSQKSIESLAQNLGTVLSTNILEFDLDRNTVIKERKSTPTRKQSVDKHDCKTHYVGMPQFKSKKIEPFHKIVFHTTMSDWELSGLFDQTVTEKTKSVWFPKLIPGVHAPYRGLGGNTTNKYPIYVVSKGRHDVCYTSKFLSIMEVKHFVCVEPQEHELYVENRQDDYATIISMDMSYKDSYDLFDDSIGSGNGTGPGAARNFCWEHSIENGHKSHWVFDDNATEGFHWRYQNCKMKLRSGSFFRAIEDFVDRYKNIAISGLNYTGFCKMTDNIPPFVMNTRIYSFLLIRNDISYRWRGRYNEDTDLSLRVLKDGLCTVQFNAMTAGKCTTQKVKGGNTAEFYSKEGTMNKSQMLVDMHPDVSSLVWKFNRWHHHVDYSGFKQKLELKDCIDLKSYTKVDNYGMKMILTDSPKNTWKTNTELCDEYSDEMKGEDAQMNEYDD